MPDLLDAIAPTAIVPSGRYGIAETGVTITIVEGAGMASIAAPRDQATPLGERCLAGFGIALPDGPRCAEGPEVAFVGLGPGRWLAISFAIADLEGRLGEALGPSAAVCDQGDAYILFDVGGARARDALAKGVAIDLDPSVFRPGDAATTSVALIGVTFWQLDAAPTFRFAVGRSFAPGFARFLVISAAEFGCVVARG